MSCSECGRPVVRGPLCKGCSRRAAWRASRPPGWDPRCAWCNDPLPSRSWWRAAYGPVYCSVGCKWADPVMHERSGTRASRPVVLVTRSCAQCGSAFTRIPSQAGPRRAGRFCSPRCYRRWTGETSIERTVRLVLESGGYDFEQEAQIGPWVVDFALGDLVIEADGAYWHSLRPGADARKTADLTARGYTVWRLPEADILKAGFATSLLSRLAAR